MPAIGMYKLVVTPEQLDSRAGSIDEYVKKLKEDFERIDNIMKATDNYWEGSAADTYRNKYKELSSQKNDAIAYCLRIPDILRTIAGTYKETEKAVEELSNALPSDVIF